MVIIIKLRTSAERGLIASLFCSNFRAVRLYKSTRAYGYVKCGDDSFLLSPQWPVHPF